MLVTTSYDATPTILKAARSLAERAGARFQERRRYSLADLKTIFGPQGVLILTLEQLIYYPLEGEPIYFHPSTGYLRVKRLLKGESDPLIELSGVQPGDSVLDCTAGLGSDAIVFSHVVGETGRVTALESELVSVLLLTEGLASYTAKIQALNDAMRRIAVVHTDHLPYLRSLPDNSYDILYFDPMFRIPVSESSAISPLREVANGDELALEAIVEAKRVARRRIVLKEHRDSPEYDRLGFTKQRTRTKVAYGVIDLC